MESLRFRSIWISDMHLGARACKAEFLLDFLKSVESDYLYLVGDIIDNIHVMQEAIHGTADGRRLLVLHGDEFDSVVKHNQRLAAVGSHVYEWLLVANRWVNYLRRKLGFPYWSLAAYLKHQVKNAVKYISNFEHAVVHEARKRSVHGVVCGHIHKPAIEDFDGVLYCNDGDWVESCTALVEHPDGRLEVIRWADESVWLLKEKDSAHHDDRGHWIATN